jgi:hypothetical protein
MVLFESRRSKDGDAGPDKMKRSKPSEQFPHDPEHHQQFVAPGIGAFEKIALFGSGLRLGGNVQGLTPIQVIGELLIW